MGGLVSAPNHVNKWLFPDSFWESRPPWRQEPALSFGLGLYTCWVLTVQMPWDVASTMSSQPTQKPMACGEQAEEDQWGSSPAVSCEVLKDRPQGKNLILNATTGIHAVPPGHLGWALLLLARLSRPVENDATLALVLMLPDLKSVTSLRQDKTGVSI